jgi:hypothetical protein
MEGAMDFIDILIARYLMLQRGDILAIFLLAAFLLAAAVFAITSASDPDGTTAICPRPIQSA